MNRIFWMILAIQLAIYSLLFPFRSDDLNSPEFYLVNLIATVLAAIFIANSKLQKYSIKLLVGQCISFLSCVLLSAATIFSKWVGADLTRAAQARVFLDEPIRFAQFSTIIAFGTLAWAAMLLASIFVVLYQNIGRPILTKSERSP